MRAASGVLMAAMVLLISDLPALAHHSFAAEYDSSKKIDTQGRGDQV